MKKSAKVFLKGDAKKVGKNRVILTSGLHSDGELKINEPMSLVDRSWSINYSVNISNSTGISDVDGVGGDGVKMKLCSESGQEILAVALDTFKNLENNSGNEVVVYFEGTKVAQATSKERFNDGKDKNVNVTYDDDLKVVVVSVNDSPVVAYAFNDFDFYDLADESVYVCFSSFTGDAGGTHAVFNIKL